MKEIFNRAGRMALQMAALIALFYALLTLTGCASGKTCMNEKFVGMGHSKWKNHIPKPVKQ